MFQRNNHGNISSKVSAIIIMVIGIGIMIVGILMAADRMRKDDYYGFATGKVVGLSYYENSDDERMYSIQRSQLMHMWAESHCRAAY